MTTDWQATGYARTAPPAWDGVWMCGYCRGDNRLDKAERRVGKHVIARCLHCFRLSSIDIGADGRITLHPRGPEDR